MARVIDLFAVLLVALLVLLPEPSVRFAPALAGDKAQLEALSALEDEVFRAGGTPGGVSAAQRVRLARAYMNVERPEWALDLLAPRLAAGPDEGFEAYQVAAHAYAERLQPKEALRTAEEGLRRCEAAGGACSDMVRIRLGYLLGMVKQLVAEDIDPRKEPLKARQRVREALRATKASAPTPAP